MKKHNYPTLTNYLAKTKKNADIYRLYNPQFSVFGKPVSEEQDFYFCYFSRHMITERNILTLFSIHTFLSYNVSKKETIKSFIHFLKKSNHDTFNNAFQFRGCNIITRREKLKRSHGFHSHGSMTISSKSKSIVQTMKFITNTQPKKGENHD